MGTRASPKRVMPARSPSACGDGGAQHERHVLDGVVLVDLQVAGGGDLDVDERVVRERRQQVVVEADAGGDAGRAAAVEVDRDRDARLARLAHPLGAPCLASCRPPVHPGAQDLDQPLVLRAGRAP